MENMAQRSFLARVIGAARLNSSVYEEVEHDRDGTKQAAVLVVLGAIAAGIGAIADGGILGLVYGVVFGLLAWAVYAWITYFIGTKLLAGAETSADWGELARTLAFANGPRLLLVIAVVPALTEVGQHDRGPLGADRDGRGGARRARHRHGAGDRCGADRLDPVRHHHEHRVRARRRRRVAPRGRARTRARGGADRTEKR